MNFPSPLLPGILIRRYKRFMADVELKNGTIVVAHCPNSGAMLGLTTPGTSVWISRATNPARKLAYTWEMAEVQGTMVGMNTSHPNALAEEAIKYRLIPSLNGYSSLKREVKYGVNSRIDILLTGEAIPPCYVEVKNVHLKRGTQALFPDSVTERGTKHLKELSTVVQEGGRAVMLYVIQRNDCDSFSLARDIDPKYTAAAADAREVGVEFIAYSCEISPQTIQIVREIPTQFDRS